MECSDKSANELNDHLRKAAALLKLTAAKRPRQCRHIKTNGEFCGSPALRGRTYCYFHLTHIGRRLRAARNHARAHATSPENAVVPLQLPPFEDADAIQIALMQVVDAILHNRIDSKRAGLVLYALQTASSNLNNGADFQQNATATVASRYDDFEEDFELGDEVPELSTDPAEEAEADEEYATATQIEQVMEACAKLERAQKKAEADEMLEADEGGDLRFYCDPVRRWLCRISGGHLDDDTPGAPQQCELDVPSQRLELLPPTPPASSGQALSPNQDKKDGAPARSSRKPGSTGVTRTRRGRASRASAA